MFKEKYNKLWQEIHEFKIINYNVLNYIFKKLILIEIEKNKTKINIDKITNYEIDLTNFPKNCNCKNNAEKIMLHLILHDIQNLNNIKNVKAFFVHFHNEINFKLDKDIFYPANI